MSGDFWADVDRLMERANEMMGSISRKSLFEFGFGSKTFITKYHQLKLDVVEDKDAVIFNIDLPGVPKESLKMHTVDGFIFVSGEAAASKLYKGGRFKYKYTVPSSVVHEKIEAKYNNGRLELILPKRKPDLTFGKREIPVG